MPTRKAHARWEGDLKSGRGKIDFGKGAFEAPYSFRSRFEEGPGTNPEELLGAAHAGCFAMALSLALGERGFTPEFIDATAHVTIAKRDGGGFAITESHLVTEAKVPGIDASTFLSCAEAAKDGCPVSKALVGVQITMEAKLQS
jgi:osmotically inducible protein OsmC